MFASASTPATPVEVILQRMVRQEPAFEFTIRHWGKETEVILSPTARAWKNIAGVHNLIKQFGVSVSVQLQEHGYAVRSEYGSSTFYSIRVVPADELRHPRAA